VIRGFFQEFQDHNPGKSSKGLNYFFNDELHIGVEKFAWNPDFPEEFARRKGYDLLEVLPAMWNDLGNLTPKVRMDYADVRMALMEERYFKPIYDWHAARDMIFACDSGGRGTDPHEFGDYFRVTRWYSAPGHDTPGGSADLIKGKVDSSIANLYQRQRVWLEGYHSMGWGATPERLMFATRENYLYGCTLLNLHGLYYTTYGSYWEWAPPCYHFRMPYWAHMDAFLDYFKRLSYLLSQGHFVADVALVYPVAPFEAEMNGQAATQTAFELARQLMGAGISFEFIDNDSLARAAVEDGRLDVKNAGAAYQALIIPNMEAVRWPTIEKAAAFAQAGGRVYCVGALPSVSDRAGRNDPELTALNDRAFPPSRRLAKPADAVKAIRDSFVQDTRRRSDRARAAPQGGFPRGIYGHGRAAPFTGGVSVQGGGGVAGPLDGRVAAVARGGRNRHRHPGRAATGILRSASGAVHARPEARESAAARHAARRGQAPAADLEHRLRADPGQHLRRFSFAGHARQPDHRRRGAPLRLGARNGSAGQNRPPSRNRRPAVAAKAARPGHPVLCVGAGSPGRGCPPA
jgi:hypothetical protein